MTVAGAQELGAGSHVMSPTHAKGLWGQAGDKKCGLYRKGDGKKKNAHTHTKQPLLLRHPTVHIYGKSSDKQTGKSLSFEQWPESKEITLANTQTKGSFNNSVFIYLCRSTWMSFWDVYHIWWSRVDEKFLNLPVVYVLIRWFHSFTPPYTNDSISQAVYSNAGEKTRACGFHTERMNNEHTLFIHWVGGKQWTPLSRPSSNSSDNDHINHHS